MLKKTAWIVLAAVLSLSGTVRGQGPDQANAVRAGRVIEAPGVQVWMGREPSMNELRGALQGVSSRPTRPRSDEPDFQNERVQLYVGRLPRPEVLIEALRAAAEARKTSDSPEGKRGERVRTTR